MKRSDRSQGASLEKRLKKKLSDPAAYLYIRDIQCMAEAERKFFQKEIEVEEHIEESTPEMEEFIEESMEQSTVEKQDETGERPEEINTKDATDTHAVSSDVLSSLSLNPFYRHACKSAEAVQERHFCPSNCSETETPWFLFSLKNKIFNAFKKRNAAVKKITAIARKHKCSVYTAEFISQAFDEKEFDKSIEVLKKTYKDSQMKRLAQRGMNSFEEWMSKESRTEDKQKFLAWKYNSCALDSVLSLVPFIMVEAEFAGLYAKPPEAPVSKAVSTNGAMLLAALHYCQHATAHDRELVSDIIREVAQDVLQEKKKFPRDARVKWTASPNQPLLDLLDVISFVLCPLVSNTPTEKVMECSVLTLRTQELGDTSDIDAIGSWLLNQCKKNGLFFFKIPYLKDSTTRLRVANLLTSDPTATKEGKRGKVLGFVGNSSITPSHFVSGLICEDDTSLILAYDGLEEELSRVNAKVALGAEPEHSKHKRFFKLDNLYVVYLAYSA